METLLDQRPTPSWVAPRPSRRGGVALFLLALFAALGIGASPAAARQGARESVVLLAPRDRPAATEQLIRALWAQLSDVNVDLRVERVASLPPVLEAQLRVARVATRPATVAVLWVEEPAGRLRILLPAAGGSRLVTRAVGSAGDAGRYEAAGVILRTAVMARRAGREVGVPVPPPRETPPRLRPSAPRPPAACAPPRACPAAAAPRPPRMALELAWAADLYSTQVLLATGLRVGVDVRVHRQWRLFLGYRLEAPLERSGGAAGLLLRRYPVDLGARFWWRSGRFRLGGRLALGVVAVQPRVLWYGPGLRPQRTGTDVVYTVTPQLSAGFQPVRRLWIVLDLGVSVQLDNVRYTAEPSGEVLAAPLVVQPALLLGVQVDLF